MQESDLLTEEQKKQLGELQLFKNKEGNVSIEVSLLDTLTNISNSLISDSQSYYLLFSLH